jgi:hypothetical protein
MFTYWSRQSLRVIFLFIVLGIVLSSCKSQSAQKSRLRIVNIGLLPINNLIVVFPQNRIRFGDIPARTTTEYQNIPNGVFSYAAYEFEVDDKTISQPVSDWVGEHPMRGNSFTYTIEFDPNRANTGDIIRLVSVKKDD